MPAQMDSSDPAHDEIRRLEEEIDELRSAVLLLHRLANLVRGALELEPTCYAVLTGATAGVGLGLNRAMIFLEDELDRSVLRGACAVGPADAEEADRVWRSIEEDAPDLETLYQAGLRQREHPGELDRRVRGTRVDAQGSSPVALALRRDAPVSGEGGDDLGGLLDLGTGVAAPLRGERSARGVLYADNRFTGRPIDPHARLVFHLIADHAGRAIESAREFERLAREAKTDALTGLGHHGSLKEDLRAACGRALDEGEPLGLVMIDLDDFKRVNDRHGHPAGDALLAGIAARLRGVLRGGEEPYRYGGEEFAVLLRGTGATQVMVVGERLRRAIGAQPFEIGVGRRVPVTCSVGVASLPQDAIDADGLIGAADGALLVAKRRGKNRVEVHRRPIGGGTSAE